MGRTPSDEEWQQAVHNWWMRADAAEGFGKQWVDATKWLGLGSRILRVGGGPIAVAGDATTIWHPPQGGSMGWVDRGVAGANAGLVGADALGAVEELTGVEGLAALSLTGVGVPLAVRTGLFLAGAYAYKH